MIIITGFQRSGTTALGENLGRSPQAAYFGEIFHPDGFTDGDRARSLRLRSDANYYRFVDEHPDLHRGPPDASRVAQQWADYLAYLDSLQPGARAILSVKYNSWHNVAAAWQDPNARPFLLDLLKAQDPLVVLHLMRGDLLAQAVSEHLASSTGVWHATDTPAAQTHREELPPHLIVERMNRCLAQRRLMRARLTDLPTVELVYEETFAPDGDLSAITRQALAPHVAPEILSEAPGVLQRIIPDLGERLSNLPQIVQAVVAAGLSDHVAPATLASVKRPARPRKTAAQRGA